MLLTILIAALVLAGFALLVVIGRAAVQTGQVGLRAEPMLLAAVTNFFDTLGIGSFAPSMAWLRFRRLVPDKRIPMTMLAGYTPPAIVQAIIFLILLGVAVDPLLLVGSIVTIITGAIIGAPIAARSPVKRVQLIVAIALLMAAIFYSLANLGLMPIGGHASALPPLQTLLVLAASFVFGILFNFGVGNYAPTLALLSLLGMDPRLAFPIMACGSSFAGAAASIRLVKLADLDPKILISLIVGSIPAVLVAAFLVREMPLNMLRWLVVVVVTYAAFSLLYAALKGETATPEERLERAVID